MTKIWHMDQNIILSKLRAGYSRVQIGTEIAKDEGISFSKGMGKVHSAALLLVEGCEGVDRTVMLAELIESTKSVQRAALEAENHGVALSAINTLAKLTGILT